MKPSTGEKSRFRVIDESDCPICCLPMKGRLYEDFTCGEHWCCKQCADRHTQSQVQSGMLPRCYMNGCKVETDPLLAMRMLCNRKDKERFLNLALWSNPCVQACPKCRCILYQEGSMQMATVSTCPACHHIFCSDCRCPQHPGRCCEDALLDHKAGVGEQSGKRQEDAEAVAMLPRKGEISPPTPRGIRGPMRTESMTNFECAVHASGGKMCPRCRTGVEKSDDGCDHMTCRQCQHEFCWSCLADRGPIYAHGNHHHRQGCTFYRPWNGRDEWLPKKCAKCAFRGRVCRPPHEKAPEMRNQYFLVFLDNVGQWFEDMTSQVASQPSFFGTCSVQRVPR